MDTKNRGRATSETYTTVLADVGTTLKFEVTPVAATGLTTGTAVESSGTAIVALVPTLSTPTSSSIGRNNVTLNGEISDIGGASVTVRGFNYGTTTSYGTDTTESGSFSTGTYTADVSSLDCGNTYHYRSYATNSAGTSYSSDQTFTTAGCPSSGSSASSRYNNLIAMGNTSAAEQLRAQYPTQINPVVTTPEACQPGDLYSTKTGQLCESNDTILTRTLRWQTPLMQGDDVRYLQNYLNTNLNLSLTVDGKFGTNTEQAVIEFQRKNHLTPDGVVGPLTRGRVK